MTQHDFLPSPADDHSPSVRVSVHDRMQLEIKASHPTPDPMAGRLEDLIDLWFFLPPSSGVTASSYQKTQFYADLRSYTRLRTPTITLGELARSDGEGSPLGVLAALLREIDSEGPDAEELREIRRESRLLACMLKGALRDAQNDLPAEGPGLAAAVEQLIARCRGLLTVWRALAEQTAALRLDQVPQHALAFVDESLSVQVEVGVLEVAAERAAGLEASVQAELVALAREEEAWRIRRGDRSVLDVSNRRSHADFLDQTGLLKKYISSVLWLEGKHHPGTDRLEQLALSLAAGLAMLWTLGLQVACLVWFGLTLQTGMRPEIFIVFVVVTVLGYILKDRIKALLGRQLAARIPRLLYDRRTDFTRFSREEQVATVTETVRFVPRAEVPPEVRALRMAHARSPLVLETDEHILWYRRHVILHPKEATRTFPAMEGVVDILRVNVWRWVRTFDRSKKPVLAIEGDLPVLLSAPNRYVADLVVRTGREGAAGQLESWRLLLDRRGLVEIQSILTPPARP